jgi:hypothetical protein
MSVAILIAIDIDHIARRACRNGHPCPYSSRKCMMDYYLPPPTEVQPLRSSVHIRRIEDCTAQFTEFLRMRGYLLD